MHTDVGGRKADLPREVGSQPEGKVNANALYFERLLR